MGDCLSKTFGWHDLVHQRNLRKLHKENRQTAEEAQRRIEDIQVMKQAAEKSQAARAKAFQELSAQLANTKKEIAKLGSHVAQTQGGEPNVLQSAQMMLLVSRQAELEKLLQGHSIALANQSSVVLTISQLETSETIGTHDRALIAASKRVINDKVEDDIEDAAEAQGDVLGRLKNVIETLKQTDAAGSDLHALDVQALNEEVKQQFKLSLDVNLKGMPPVPISAKPVGSITAVAAVASSTSTTASAPTKTATKPQRPRVSQSQAQDIKAAAGVARVLSSAPVSASATSQPQQQPQPQQSRKKDIDELS